MLWLPEDNTRNPTESYILVMGFVANVELMSSCQIRFSPPAIDLLAHISIVYVNTYTTQRGNSGG